MIFLRPEHCLKTCIKKMGVEDWGRGGVGAARQCWGGAVSRGRARSLASFHSDARLWFDRGSHRHPHRPSL